MDKAFWQTIREQDCAVPEDCTVLDLTPELIAMLGATDPVLRDELASAIFGCWIERGLYTPDHLRGLAMHLVTNLGIGLGEPRGDGVFLRATSAFALAQIIARDNKRNFLSQNEVENLFHWSLAYLRDERDLRGFVPKKGWAAALTRSAELLRALARNRHLTLSDLETLLTALAERVTTPTATVFAHDEDERLVAVVWTVLQRQLVALPFLADWLERCTGVMALVGADAPFEPNRYAAYQNTRLFLRSLYFRLAFARNRPELNRKLQAQVLEAVRAVQE